MNHRLVVIIGGHLTPSRLAHTHKILELVHSFFHEIIVVHEGKNSSLFNQPKVIAYGDGKEHEYPRKSIMLSIFEIAKRDLQKGGFILRMASPGDVALFLGVYQPISLMAAKIRHIKTLIFGGGFDVWKGQSGKAIIDELGLLVRWTFQITMLMLFDKIILETPSVELAYNLGRFRKKIYHLSGLYVDEHFNLNTSLSKRDFDIAYIGALSPEKGADLFIKSVRLVRHQRQINALIVGDGILKSYIQRFVEHQKLHDVVELTGWVKHSNLPLLLSRVKILVIPSRSEGLPNVLLEAMANGALVLATRVGGIPDVIKHEKTGFILNSNDSRHIATQVLKLLNNFDHLESVRANAQRIIAENYTKKAAMKRWSRIFADVMEHT